jgi:hypothetical protein
MTRTVTDTEPPLKTNTSEDVLSITNGLSCAGMFAEGSDGWPNQRARD